MCSVAQSTPPVRRGLWCHNVSRGIKHTTRQERAPELLRVSRLQIHPVRRKALTSPCDRGTRTTTRQGSGIAMCPVAPNLSSSAGGLWSRHVTCGPRPPGRARAFPRRMTSWPHQAQGAGSALNAYVTGHTQRMAGIKYVQDIDAAGRRQYDTDLLVTRNGQATV
jgi:hypothetical protein